MRIFSPKPFFAPSVIRESNYVDETRIPKFPGWNMHGKKKIKSAKKKKMLQLEFPIYDVTRSVTSHEFLSNTRIRKQKRRLIENGKIGCLLPKSRLRFFLFFVCHIRFVSTSATVLCYPHPHFAYSTHTISIHILYYYPQCIYIPLSTHTKLLIFPDPQKLSDSSTFITYLSTPALSTHHPHHSSHSPIYPHCDSQSTDYPHYSRIHAPHILLPQVISPDSQDLRHFSP